MKNKLLIALLYIFGHAVNAQTDSSGSFSLQQAIEFALKNQTNVKNARIDQELAQKKVNEITGMGLPQINASFDVRNFLDIPTSLVPASAFGGPSGIFIPAQFGTQYQGSAGFDASQLLFSGEYLLGLKASKVYADLSTKAMERTKIETAVAVSKAYYAVLINQQRLKLMDANIERVKTAMGGAQGLYAYGFAEKLDYDRLVVTHNNLLVEKEKIDRLVALSTYLLKYQMGMDVFSPVALTDKLEDVTLDISKDVNAEKFDYSKRVEYNLFETQQKLAQLDLKKNKVAFLPTAVAYANVTRNGFSRNTVGDFDLFKNGNTWYPTSVIGAKVTMPIFTGFQRNAKTQQAKLSLQKAENNIESLKKSIDLEMASSVTMLQNASVSLENQKKNIVLAEEIYKASKLKFEQGVGTNLELVSAETTLVEAQTNYFNALYDAIVAKIDFDKANGNLKY
jgi:outer membrane protein